jgi:hypothetical protein
MAIAEKLNLHIEKVKTSSMHTIDYLKWGLRLFFCTTTTMAIGQGSLFAMVLCVTIFLIMEYFVEDLENTANS